MIDLIKDVLFTITHPASWLMLNNYDADYDKFINKIIDDKTEIISGFFTSEVMINPSVTIWTSNFPYSYGNIYYPRESKDRPSRRTIYRLKKYISETNYR